MDDKVYILHKGCMNDEVYILHVACDECEDEVFGVFTSVHELAAFLFKAGLGRMIDKYGSAHLDGAEFLNFDEDVRYFYVERMIIDDAFVKPKIINDKEILEEYYKVLKENCGVTLEEACKKVKK